METPTRWRELFQQGRGRLTAGILLVEFLVAVESLVVIAIMPAARRDLGGIEFYGLVFAGFSLAALVLSPIAGRAADRRGPAQPFLLFGTLFIVGTVLCGLAPSMSFQFPEPPRTGRRAPRGPAPPRSSGSGQSHLARPGRQMSATGT